MSCYCSARSIAETRETFQRAFHSYEQHFKNEVAAKQLLGESSSSIDLPSLSLDIVSWISEGLLLELQAGYTERVIASLQAVVELNTAPSPCSIEEFTRYWESEFARVGDIEGGDGGIESWRRAGQPEDGWRVCIGCTYGESTGFDIESEEEDDEACLSIYREGIKRVEADKGKLQVEVLEGPSLVSEDVDEADRDHPEVMYSLVSLSSCSRSSLSSVLSLSLSLSYTHI